MDNIHDYVNSIRDDFYNIFVLNRPPTHRVSSVKESRDVETSLTSTGLSDKLVFDYESDTPEDDKNLLYPWV